jgi:hypothetical protein
MADSEGSAPVTRLTHDDLNDLLKMLIRPHQFVEKESE